MDGETWQLMFSQGRGPAHSSAHFCLQESEEVFLPRQAAAKQIRSHNHVHALQAQGHSGV